MRLSRLRLGELLALAGAICVIVSLFVPWYENSLGKLSAWDTFGPAAGAVDRSRGGGARVGDQHDDRAKHRAAGCGGGVEHAAFGSSR